LKEAGPQGLHTKDISALQPSVNSTTLNRVLRHLAAHHVFKEVAPNVFANNRNSSALSKTKTLNEIRADPLHQYDGAGIPAFIAHLTDETLQSSVAMPAFLQDPKGMPSPFHIAMKCGIWEWFKKPENAMHEQRFIEAMKGQSTRWPPWIFKEAIDWSALKAGSVCVDVGGNVGDLTMTLAKAFPHLECVVQDQEKPILEAEKFWAAIWPEAISSKQVKLQAYDFFTPQPVKNAAVYSMRFIIHDWPDAESKKIMQTVRDAAGPSSKLILWENVVPYALRDTAQGNLLFPAALGLATALDMHMLNLCGSQERTLDEFIELGKASGWKFESVKTGGVHPIASVVFSAA